MAMAGCKPDQENIISLTFIFYEGLPEHPFTFSFKPSHISIDVEWNNDGCQVAIPADAVHGGALTVSEA